MADDGTNFETRVCSRCAGSGRYSYTPRFGDTCFKCGGRPHVPGSGRVLSAAGSKARAAWEAANTEVVTYGDMAAGDKVSNGGRRWTVVSVEHGNFGANKRSGDTEWNVHDTALVDRHGTRHVGNAADPVTRWIGDFAGPPKMPANTDRAKEMRAYVKSAAAHVANRSREDAA